MIHCVSGFGGDPFLFEKRKKQPDVWPLSSPQTMGKANGILREQFTQPVGSLTHVTQQIRVAQLLSWSPTINQK